MAITLNYHETNNALHLSLSGRLDRKDYEKWVPEFESLVEKHGKLNILVELVDFEGWDAGGLWEDLKFDAKHFNDVKRLALVGDKTWEKFMAKVCKPFTSAEVKYFEPEQIADARTWIGLPIQPTPARAAI